MAFSSPARPRSSWGIWLASRRVVSECAETFAATSLIRRNGAIVRFDAEKIAIALGKAFLAVEGSQGAISARQRDLVARLTETVVQAFSRRLPSGGTLHIEDIQDQVELALMRSGEHDVARAYVLYREKRAAERASAQENTESPQHSGLHVLDGELRRPLDTAALLGQIQEACAGLGDVSAETVLQHALHNLYDGVPVAAVRQSLVLAARTLIERDPDYSKLAARLLLRSVSIEVLGEGVTSEPTRVFRATLP